MKRTLFTAMLVLGLATSANALSVSVTADQTDLTYNIGETISLTIDVVVAGTEIPGSQIRAILDYDQGLTTALGGSFDTFNTLGILGWTPGTFQGDCDWALDNSRDGQCNVIDQLTASTTAAMGAGTFSGTYQYVADAAGTAVFNWVDAAAADWVIPGIANPTNPGATVTIVPEPTTAALFGLGLLGLALGGRRR